VVSSAKGSLLYPGADLGTILANYPRVITINEIVQVFLGPFTLHNNYPGSLRKEDQMNHVLALSFLLFVVGQEKLPFQPGQSVYVVATRTNTKIDLAAEATVISEFEKQRRFKIGRAEVNADFVFLVLTEYDSYSSGVWVTSRRRVGIPEPKKYLKGAIAWAIPSKAYAEHKDDLEKLREVSVWQGAATRPWYKRDVSLSKLVKDFHNQFEKLP
jgi:hypothetical protein